MWHRTIRFEPSAADRTEKPDRAQGQKDSAYEHAADLPPVDLRFNLNLKPLAGRSRAPVKHPEP